ncbi:MAG: hypothetical protein J7J72_00545 [Bacteroidales bacterium]|nr:hypothetical protein [Bacteroidales bacterium]
MDKEVRINKGIIFRKIARYTSLTLGVLVFVFALISGSVEYGGGIQGIIKNSPNALPWLLFLLLVFVAWKWEVVGGIVIIILGLSFLYVFNFPSAHFFSTASIISFLIIFIGVCYILSWYYSWDNSKNEEF